MDDNYIVDKKLFKQQERFYKLAYDQSGKCVEECALLQRTIRNLFAFLSNNSLEGYPIENRFYHKITTENIGTFVAVRAFNQKANQSILIIKSWDWKINPYVYPNLYPLLLSKQPIYEKVGDGGCDFTIVKDARGYYNFINKKRKPLSDEWFKNVTPFKNINNLIIAYVRRLNGNVYYIDNEGFLHEIIDNYNRQNAEALLGEALVRLIILECIRKIITETKLNKQHLI